MNRKQIEALRVAVLKGMAQFRVLNTCLYPGFRAGLADREEVRIP